MRPFFGSALNALWQGTKIGSMAAAQSAGAMVTLGGVAGAAGLGLAYGAQRLAYAAVGGQFVDWAPVKGKWAEKIGLHTPTVPMRAQLAIGAGMVGFGVAKGAYQYAQSKRWNLTHALATGQVEVERENFLGATGSLTIASSRRKPGLPTSGPGVQIDPHAAALVAEDVLTMASRLAMR